MDRKAKRYNRLFPTGIPVVGNNLAGRAKEIEKIKLLLKNGQSVILHGPRRIGKTSLALTILNELKKEGIFTGHVDIFECATLQVLSQRITETTLENKKNECFTYIDPVTKQRINNEKN